MLLNGSIAAALLNGDFETELKLSGIVFLSFKSSEYYLHLKRKDCVFTLVSYKKNTITQFPRTE